MALTIEYAGDAECGVQHLGDMLGYVMRVENLSCDATLMNVEWDEGTGQYMAEFRIDSSGERKRIPLHDLSAYVY